MIVGVVTPVLNGAHLIEATATSVLNQTAITSGNVTLKYVIQDGNSTDGTLECARRLAGEVATIHSASDTGMYDALARGWAEIERQGGADWYCYLNAGDLWDTHCLELLQHFAAHTDADWICGAHAYYAAWGVLVQASLPFRYRRNLLRQGRYGRGLPTVQQESTFWQRSLQSTIDMKRLSTFKVAGDAFLWWQFAARSEPTIIQAVLAGFSYHGGHLGSNPSEYAQEISSFAEPGSLSGGLALQTDRAMWEAPARLKRLLNPNLYLYSTSTGGWVGSHGEIPALNNG